MLAARKWRAMPPPRLTLPIARHISHAVGINGLPTAFVTPRHPPHSSLPELRACFVEQLPVRVADIAASDREELFGTCFRSMATKSLDDLMAEHRDDSQPVFSDEWREIYTPVSNDDTLLLGLRANVRYDKVATGRFEHRYIAWSKAQGCVAAQGGATVMCARDGGSVPIPAKWVYRMEVEFGDTWAAVQILEFRREAGLGSHLGTVDIDSDLK